MMLIGKIFKLGDLEPDRDITIADAATGMSHKLCAESLYVPIRKRLTEHNQRFMEIIETGPGGVKNLYVKSSEFELLYVFQYIVSVET